MRGGVACRWQIGRSAAGEAGECGGGALTPALVCSAAQARKAGEGVAGSAGVRAGLGMG